MLQNQQQIIKEYEKKAEEITQKMLTVLIRAQRKNDDAAYRKILGKLQ